MNRIDEHPPGTFDVTTKSSNTETATNSADQQHLCIKHHGNLENSDSPGDGFSGQGEIKSAKEKRDNYRTNSSGYGTGGSHESCSRSQEMIENEVFEDIYSASETANVASCRNDANFVRLASMEASGHCKFSSDRESMTSGSSTNSNDTVIDRCLGYPVKIPLLKQEDFRIAPTLLKPFAGTSNTERLLSGEQVSFEIQISENDQAFGTTEKEEDHPSSENNDFSSLFEGDLSLLTKYISEQQNPPIYAPISNSHSSHHQDVDSCSSHQYLSEFNHSTEFLGSLVESEDCSICSIAPSKDGHVSNGEMEKMYNSAMHRLNKQLQQQKLQSMFTAFDKMDASSDIFQELENLNLNTNCLSLDSMTAAKEDVFPSNQDPIDNFVRQMVRGRDLSHSNEGSVAASSADSMQLAYNFPYQNMFSPPINLPVEYEENQDLLLQRLQMAALCLDRSCSDIECSMGQELLEHLEDRLEQNLTYESTSCQQMLKAIAWHAELCEEIKCPLPYCQFFQETDIPFSEQIARLQQTLYSTFIDITDVPSNSDLFLKISARIPVDKPLQEGVDWNIVSRIGRFGKGPHLVVPSMYHVDMPEYWVVKKISMSDDENKMRLLKSFSGTADDHVIHLLWLLHQESSLYMCSQFEGMSMAEYLKCKDFECGLGKKITLMYLKQLISAVRYLHKKNLLYLNWTSDHIIVDNDRVKLCNLATVVECNGITYDEDMLEDIMMTLPPQVLPMELLRPTGVGEYCDIWGLGCITFEMYCGCKPHHHLRHKDLSGQRMEIAKNPVPDLTRVKDVQLLNILNNCFRVNYKDRPNLSALQALVDRIADVKS